MAAERREDRCTIFWFLTIMCALQAAVSLALPVLHSGTLADGKKTCIAIYASTATVQPTPIVVARLLAQHPEVPVQGFILSIPPEETTQMEEEEAQAGGEGALEPEGNDYKLCPGEWSYASLPPSALKLLDYSSTNFGSRTINGERTVSLPVLMLRYVCS